MGARARAGEGGRAGVAEVAEVGRLRLHQVEPLGRGLRDGAFSSESLLSEGGEDREVGAEVGQAIKMGYSGRAWLEGETVALSQYQLNSPNFIVRKAIRLPISSSKRPNINLGYLANGRSRMPKL